MNRHRSGETKRETGGGGGGFMTFMDVRVKSVPENAKIRPPPSYWSTSIKKREKEIRKFLYGTWEC